MWAERRGPRAMRLRSEPGRLRALVLHRGGRYCTPGNDRPVQDLTPGPTRPDLPVLEGRRSGQGDPLGSVGDTLGDRVRKSNGLGNGKEGRTEPRKPEADCVESPDWMLPLREGRPRGCPASPFVGAGAQGPHRRTRGHQESGVLGSGESWDIITNEVP